MNQTAIFRCLVLGSLILAVLGSLVDLFVPGLLPPKLDEAYNAHVVEEPSLGLAIAMGVAALIFIVAVGVGTVGFWQFKRWGRGLSFWLTVVSVASYPLLGPVLYSGWALMLTEVGMMLWGAALAMAYFSELKLRFEGEGARVMAG